MASGLMQSIDDSFKRFFNARFLERAVLVIVILVAGYLLVALLLVISRRFARKRLSPQSAGIVEKAVKYVGVVVVLINAAEAVGFDLSAALGAAGIVGIALGFAAQTSVSNIISGLFLFSEKTFEIGDVLQIENMTGTIESVDLLSVKIRTFDNRLVRVPNETMIKSKMVNATRWPERRLDLKITLPIGVHPVEVEKLLREAASSVPAARAEPKPTFALDALDAAGLRFAFGVWFDKKDYYAFKTTLFATIISKFEDAGLEPTLQSASLWDFPDGP
jgi:small-conductance mechanosensitive channel